jgi:hypothetical protein
VLGLRCRAWWYAFCPFSDGVYLAVRLLLSALCLCLLVVIAPGCSTESKQVTVKGKLLNHGSPLKVDPKVGVTVSLVPVVEQGKAATNFPANFNRDDATFDVPGPQGKGIPPGRYRVSVFQQAISIPEWMADMNEQFSPSNTRIVRDIEKDTDIVVDLSKPED